MIKAIKLWWHCLTNILKDGHRKVTFSFVFLEERKVIKFSCCECGYQHPENKPFSVLKEELFNQKQETTPDNVVPFRKK